MYYDAPRYWTERAQRQGLTYVAKGGRPGEYRKEFDAVAPFLAEAVKGATRVLDFGCGSQRFREPLSSGGAAYTGVDLVPGKGTQPLGRSLGLEQYDVAVATFVLQHIVDPYELAHWVRELHNCLKPGGRLLLVDHDGEVVNPNPHMASRRKETIFSLAPWAGIEHWGQYGPHWMGVMLRGVDLAAGPLALPAPLEAKSSPVPVTTLALPAPSEPTWALVMGGGSCVWDDIKALRQLLDTEWPGLVIAVNDVGSHWPGRLDHWATLHPEKLKNWIAERKHNGLSEGFQTWSRVKKVGAMNQLKPWGGGASGLLGVQLALELGCQRVVLCGIPMTTTPHFAESKMHHAGTKWISATGHWAQWPKNLPRMAHYVRSMSGRTRELLGEPTRDWFYATSAAQQASP